MQSLDDGFRRGRRTLSIERPTLNVEGKSLASGGRRQSGRGEPDPPPGKTGPGSRYSHRSLSKPQNFAERGFDFFHG